MSIICALCSLQLRKKNKQTNKWALYNVLKWAVIRSMQCNASSCKCHDSYINYWNYQLVLLLFLVVLNRVNNAWTIDVLSSHQFLLLTFNGIHPKLHLITHIDNIICAYWHSNFGKQNHFCELNKSYKFEVNRLWQFVGIATRCTQLKRWFDITLLVDLQELLGFEKDRELERKKRKREREMDWNS